MKRRRLVAVGVLAAATAAAIGVACTFPSVEFDATGDAGVGPATMDSATDTSTRPSDASVLEATTRDDATSRVPDGSCDLVNDCDCDRDSFKRASCDSGLPPDASFDCDDFDPLRKPGAGFSSVVPDQSQKPSGDWNCNGATEKAYTVNLTCTNKLTSCSGGAGFKNDPPCGTAADYYDCALGNPVTDNCTPGKVDNRIQLCK